MKYTIMISGDTKDSGKRKEGKTVATVLIPHSRVNKIECKGSYTEAIEWAREYLRQNEGAKHEL